MKTLLLSLSIVVMITNVFTTNAQENKTVFNLGAGVLYGVGLNISCDHHIVNWNEHSALTAGGYLGVQRGDRYGSDYDSYLPSKGSNHTYSWDRKWLLAPRIGYVYSLNQRFDLYAVLMPGLLMNDKYNRESIKYSFYTGIAGGGRVRLFNNVFLFTELGYNILCLNAGFSFKF